jgi:hypothetical protein
MILKQSVIGYLPSQNRESDVDRVCNKLLEVIKEKHSFEKLVDDAIITFTISLEKWEKELGKSRRGTKDVEAFTLHLLDVVTKGSKNKIDNLDSNKNLSLTNDAEKIYLGRIISVIRDKYGYHYGFIEKDSNTIFFHSKDNKNFNFDEIKGKQAMFKIVYDKKSKLENTKQKAVLEKII